MDEAERIKNVYRQRKERSINPYSILFSLQREKEIEKVILSHGFSSLKNRKVLDVGCGNGSILNYLLKFDASPEDLYGIDLVPERIEKARKLYPRINFICGNADKLLYLNNYFDIVMQFTVFTSIIDTLMRRKIASQMDRVLKPNGLIIWHDYRFNNPFNPDVKGIRKKEIISLFPDHEIEFKLIHLNPFIGRLVARISTGLYHGLERIPILRTHWIARIKKRGSVRCSL